MEEQAGWTKSWNLGSWLWVKVFPGKGFGQVEKSLEDPGYYYWVMSSSGSIIYYGYHAGALWEAQGEVEGWMKEDFSNLGPERQLSMEKFKLGHLFWDLGASEQERKETLEAWREGK